MTTSDNVTPGDTKKPPFWFGLTNKAWMSWKFLLLFKNGAMGAILPYMVVYLRARHLAPSQIGLIECLVPFLGAISRPIVAQIADKTNRHKIVMACCILLYSVFVSALYFIRPPSEPHFPVYPVDLTYIANNNTFRLSTSTNKTNSLLLNITLMSPAIHLSASSRASARWPVSATRRCSLIGNVCRVTCKNFEKAVGIASSSGMLMSSSSEIFFGKIVGNVSSHHTEVPLHCGLDCLCSRNRSTIDAGNAALYVDSQSDLTPTEMFIAILVLRLCGAIFFAPVFSLEDAIIYDVLGPANRVYWGQQKTLGFFSMGLFAFLVGLLIDYTSFDSAFLVYAILNIAAILVAFLWIPQPKQHHHGKAPNRNFCTALRQLCSKPLFDVAGFVAVASGVFYGIQFVIWPQWVLHLGASNTLIGVTTVTGSTVEAVGFFFAGFVVRRFGEVACFLAMFVAYAARFFAYSFLTPPFVWLSLPLELAQIFCFPFFLGALTMYAATIAPQGLSATVQAILQACYFGLGLGIGILSSGAVLENLGGARTFQLYAAGSTICFLLLLILHLAYLRKVLDKKASKEKEAADADASSSLTLQQTKDDAGPLEQQEILLEQQSA